MDLRDQILNEIQNAELLNGVVAVLFSNQSSPAFAFLPAEDLHNHLFLHLIPGADYFDCMVQV